MPAAVREDLLDSPEAGPRAIRGGVLRLLGHGAGALVTLVSSAVIIRHLGVVDTGRFVTVTALVTIVASISDLGLSAFGVREYSLRGGGAGRALLRNLLGMRLAFALAGLAVAVVFGLVASYTSAMVIGTVLAGLGMVLYVVQQSQAIPLHVSLRFGWVAALQFLLQASVAAGGVALALAGAGLLPFFALQLSVMVPIILLTALIGGHETRVGPAAQRAEWKLMATRILPYSAAVILSVLYFRLAQIMVSVLSTDVQTGYFGVSFRVLETITMIPPLLVSSALPILARAAQNNEDRFVFASRRLAETMLIVGVGVAVSLFLAAHLAVEVVAGSGFDPAIDVVRILAVALVGTFIIAARGYALLSLDRTRTIMLSNAAALAAVLILGVPLIRAHGAIGGAIALVLGELVLAACYEYALGRAQPAARLTAVAVGRCLVAALVAVLPVLLLDPPALVMPVVGSIVFAAVIVASGGVPADLRRDLFARSSAPEPPPAP